MTKTDYGFQGLMLMLLIATLLLLCVDFQAAWAEVGEKAAIHEAMGPVETEGNPLTRKRWSPYTTGIAIGVLSWLAFLLIGKGLGVSSSYAKTSGMVEKAVKGEKVYEIEYYQEKTPKIDTGWMLVFGIIIGAFLSARLSGDFQLTAIPPLWKEMFGDNVLIRIIVAFIGGMVLIIGARWARGCTSGHGITGTLQLAVSSWMALFAFFIGGVITAYLLYAVSAL